MHVKKMPIRSADFVFKPSKKSKSLHISYQQSQIIPNFATDVNYKRIIDDIFEQNIE